MMPSQEIPPDTPYLSLSEQINKLTISAQEIKEPTDINRRSTEAPTRPIDVSKEEMHTAAQVVADAAEALTTAAQASLDEVRTQSRQTRPDSHAEAAKRSPHAKAVACCTSQARTIYLTPPSDDSGLPFHEVAPQKRFAAKSPLHPASCTEWCDRHTFDAADTADTLRQASCSGATEMSSMQETPYYNGPATRCVDFIRLHRHQVTFAARPRWPMPWETSRMLCVFLPHARPLGVDRAWSSRMTEFHQSHLKMLSVAGRG